MAIGDGKEGGKVRAARFTALGALERAATIETLARIGIIAALALACGACAHNGSATGGRPAASERPANRAPDVDSVTVGLWHLDETGGAHVTDAGPKILDGTAGLETRTDFGRFGRARLFTRALDSFVLIPYSPALETRAGFAIEAWVRLASLGAYEDTPIACRWVAQTADHSWVFSVTGRQLAPPIVTNASPGDHAALVRAGPAGLLMFAFQPEEAGAPRVYFSTQPLELDRWIHVAATYDGAVVRLWLNGDLDAQYASPGRIRPSQAPLEMGNALDPRILSTFGGDLRAMLARDPTPYYAFEGAIDEVRLSSVARERFESVRRP